MGSGLGFGGGVATTTGSGEAVAAARTRTLTEAKTLARFALARASLAALRCECGVTKYDYVVCRPATPSTGSRSSAGIVAGRVFA